MLIGIVSGILAGIIVSVVSVTISYFRRPRFELRYANHDTVTLRNNRLWPVVIGGSYEFGNRSDIYGTPDNRFAASGILVGGLSEMNLRSTDPPPPIGAVVDFSYKVAPLRPLRYRDKWTHVLKWRKDPGDFIGVSSRKLDGWKVKSLKLRHS